MLPFGCNTNMLKYINIILFVHLLLLHFVLINPIIANTVDNLYIIISIEFDIIPTIFNITNWI